MGWIRCLLSQSGLRQRLLVSCMVLGDVSDKPFPKKGKGCLQTKVRPVLFISVNALHNCDPLFCTSGAADRGGPSALVLLFTVCHGYDVTLVRWPGSRSWRTL